MRRSVTPRRRIRREVFEYARLHQALPDKSFDSWTMTPEVRESIQRFFKENQNAARNWTVLEIGSYVGYTTSVIASLVKKVVAVDILPQFLEFNKLFNENHHNIDHIPLETYRGDWSVLDKYAFDVVIIDGGQDWRYVRNDFLEILKLKPVPPLLIFDDYGNDWHVQMVVVELKRRGLLQCHIGLGKRISSKFVDLHKRGVNVSEAMVCTTDGMT